MSKSICDENKCTGCTACMNICPQKCICMIENEDGFVYPHIDEQACVGCDLCRNVCPINRIIESDNICEALVVRNSNENTLINSTSGGAFSAIADFVLDNNGVVYAVVVDRDFKVKHIRIDTKERFRIKEMRGSKYVQSQLNDVFFNVIKDLKDERLVCFCGSPCQVAGLKSFVNFKTDKLILIDFVCKGVASPAVFKGYIDHQEKKHKSKIKEIRFRNKTYGYHSGTMKIEFENNKIYYGSGRVDLFLKSYYKEICSRNSCYTCSFKGDSHCSDFTIFDCWHVTDLVPTIKDDNKGYTNVIIQSYKGKELLNELKGYWDSWNVNYEVMKEKDGIMIENSAKQHKNREQFISCVKEKGIEEAVKKYIPISKSDYLGERAKLFLHKLGLLRFVKTIKVKIKGKK